MTPLILGLGVPELLIILAVVLLLFGGARLAGLGKSTGRAIREFKEETKGLTGSEDPSAPGNTAIPPAQQQQPYQQQPYEPQQYQQQPPPSGTTGNVQDPVERDNPPRPQS